MSKADMNAYWKKILGGKKEPAPEAIKKSVVQQDDIEEIIEIQESLEQLSWNMAEMMKSMAKQQKEIAKQSQQHGCNRCASNAHCHCNGSDNVLLVQPAQKNVRIASPVETVHVASPVQHVRTASPVQHVRVASPVQHVRVASPVQHVRVASPVQHVRVASPVQLVAPCSHHCSTGCTQNTDTAPASKPTTCGQSKCPLHSCNCMMPKEKEPEPVWVGPQNHGCQQQAPCQQHTPCCRPKSPLYVLQDPGLISEDLPDDEISALKERVKKLEDPDNEPLGKLMDGIEDIKNQLLATAEALNDRMNQINEKCDKGDINSNNIINRVQNNENNINGLCNDIKNLKDLISNGGKIDSDFFQRLKDISEVHEFIKQELQNITMKMATMNNLDNIVDVQRERLSEAEDTLRQHCDEETTARNQFLQKLQDIENALKKLEQNKSDSDRRTDKLTDRLDSLARSIQEQNSKVDRMNSDISTAIKDFDKQINKLEPQLDRQRDLIDGLKNERDNNKSDLQRLRDKLEGLEKVLRQLSELPSSSKRRVSTNNIEEITVTEVATTESARGGGGGTGGGGGASSSSAQQQSSSSSGNLKGFLQNVNSGKENDALKSGAITPKSRRSSVLVMTT
ncbi:uncharacterized protein LOC134821542 isoform X2 [Bolinopsis microptera]|uniref:uncharacterized protein LOC134821542 isoform X2 n=1 Tax=Bolinopsis microptera TaxID=2820187 RepID=UPI003078C9E8